MSFWKSNNNVPVEQTYSAHSATNGLSYSPGQVIHIDIPPTTQYIKPDDSYLQMDVKLSALAAGGHKTRLQLDAQIGAQSLIRDIRIYSSTETGGRLLEEIQDYNALVAVKYDYDTDDSLKNKRAVGGEGCTTHKPESRGTLGTSKSMCADIETNPFFKSPSASNQTTAFTADDFLTAKCCIPLHTGIWSSPKVFPNLYTGIRIEIVLEDASKCVRQLESALRFNKLFLNPVFSSSSGTSAAATGLATDDTTDRIYVRQDNSQTGAWKSPFVVHEHVNLVYQDGTNSGSWTDSSGHFKMPKVLSINSSATADLNEGLVEIVFEDTMTWKNASTAVAGSWYVYSDSVEQKSACDVAASHQFVPNYLVSNVEMIIQEVSVNDKEASLMQKQMSEGGAMMYDVLSYTNYKYSQLANDIVANIRIPMNNSRARSVLCVPTDATKYNAKDALTATGTYNIEGGGNGNGTSNATRSGLVGIADELSNYQFLYDGKLQPSRQVPCSKTSGRLSIDQQPLIELEKALVQADIPCRSLSQFRNNFVIGRALSLNSGVYDTRGKDFNLQVNYQGSVAPTKNKLWFMFVAHLRRITIKGDSIMVDV